MKLIALVMATFIGLSVQAAQVEITSNADSVKAQGFHSYNFGTVWTNTRSEVRFTLRNTGTTPLTYKEAYIYGADFSARHSCVNGLQPNETCTFSIAYWPMFEGMASGRFVLNFQEDQVVVDLWGQARRM
ncbi:choice-of-anchor D domain-containing protein [bacterium]|nr:choice-of-anchor D domain-containing protein [bacterium]